MTTSVWIDATVTRKSAVATDIVELEISASDGSALPPFSAGSHIDVEIASGLVRQYSLLGSTSAAGRYGIAVLREPGSRGGSAGVHDRIAQGDRIRISAPRNLFALHADAQQSYLFAGGIGITPILCMAHHLYHAGHPFALHYSARSPADAAYRGDIESGPLAPFTQFHFSSGAPQDRLQPGRDVPAYVQGHHLYACGPARFIEAILAAGHEAGWPRDAMHREYFAATQLEAADPSAFAVRIASSGAEFQVPPDQSIAQVLHANGIDLPMSCEQGICGTCVTRILQGVADHRDMFLTEDEQARNDQMTPCCSRSKTPLLILDL